MPIITFDRNTGGGVSSSVDKSEVPPMTAFCTDIKGCGLVTHLKTAFNGNFNFRSDCAPPQTLYNISSKSLTLLDGAINGVVPRPPNTNQAELHAYLTRSMREIISGNSPTIVDPEDFFGGNGVWELRGNQWYLATTGGLTAQVLIPRVKPLVDQCGVTYAYKGSSTYTIQQTNTITCVPELLHVLSLGVIISTNPAAVLQDAASYDALFTQSRMNTQSPFTAVVGTTDCPNYPAQAFAATLANYGPLPSTINLGVVATP